MSSPFMGEALTNNSPSKKHNRAQEVVEEWNRHTKWLDHSCQHDSKIKSVTTNAKVAGCNKELCPCNLCWHAQMITNSADGQKKSNGKKPMLQHDINTTWRGGRQRQFLLPFGTALGGESNPKGQTQQSGSFTIVSKLQSINCILPKERSTLNAQVQAKTTSHKYPSDNRS